MYFMIQFTLYKICRKYKHIKTESDQGFPRAKVEVVINLKGVKGYF